MSLRHVTRKNTSRSGCPTWQLETLEGEVIEAFGVFCADIADLAENSQKRYVVAVSRFIDYLFEAKVFSSAGVTARRLNEVVEAYPLLLRDGSEGVIQRIEELGSPPADAWLVEVARALNWERLKPGSFSSTLAPVNRFLDLSETIARQEVERANAVGTSHDQSTPLFRALHGSVKVSSHEVARLRHNSMLGSVAKSAGKGMRRPRRLVLRGQQPQEDSRNLDFPIEHVQRVVEAATCWRDKALWLLLAASGIRSSEAKNILLCDVCFESQTVFVVDPKRRRFALPPALQNALPFKGRTMAETYLFPPLREEFFHALRMYLEQEFVPAFNAGRPQFLFQYVEPSRRGHPLVTCGAGALNKPFKAAVTKADVPLPHGKKDWTLHSLRHLYGTYMHNDYPLDPAQGRYGLDLVDVQMLMGHRNVSETRKYARKKAHRLMAKLRVSDEQMHGLHSPERFSLPSALLNRLAGMDD